jgi:hypothetical protein
MGRRSIGETVDIYTVGVTTIGFVTTCLPILGGQSGTVIGVSPILLVVTSYFHSTIILHMDAI